MISRQTEFQHVYASPGMPPCPPLHFPTERPTITRPFGMFSQNPSKVTGRWWFIPVTPLKSSEPSIVSGDVHSLPLIVMNQRRQALEPLINLMSPW